MGNSNSSFSSVFESLLACNWSSSTKKRKLNKEEGTSCSQETSRLVRGSDSGVSYGNSDVEQVTIYVRNEKPMAKLFEEFSLKFPKDEFDSDITGSVFLADSRLVLIDKGNKRIKVFSPSFTPLRGKPLTTIPRDIAVQDGYEVAVTFPEESSVHRYCLKTTIKDKGQIPTGIKCQGISYIKKSKLILTSGALNIIKILNVKKPNKRLESTYPELDCPWHCCVDKSRTKLYVSSYWGNSVCGIDLISNEVLFTYTHEDLKYPEGLDVGGDGHIYVCGRGTNNVHQISPSGEHVQILLSIKDGIVGPETISFSSDGEMFVLTEWQKQTAKVYVIR